VIVETENMYFLRTTERRERAEYEQVVCYLREHPDQRTWFTFDLPDGQLWAYAPAESLPGSALVSRRSVLPREADSSAARIGLSHRSIPAQRESVTVPGREA
jgi:hypothetical protein